MASIDIADIIRDWSADEREDLRYVTDPEGRETLQLRVAHGAFTGVLEMPLDGRPDGARPHGHAFLLDYFEALAAAQPAAVFTLAHDACEALAEEARQLHERYAFLMRVGDFERVWRDCERNLRCCRFLRRHAENPRDRGLCERLQPSAIRLRGSACAMLAVLEGNFDDAGVIVAEMRAQLRDLPESLDPECRDARRRNLQAIEDFARGVEGERPPTVMERLNRQLECAVAEEDYERAAGIRDRIHDMNEALIGMSAA